MKGLVLLVASLLPISIEALLCRVCSSTLNGNQVSGVCENQGDNGRLVLCREGFHSCYYRFDETSKHHGIQTMYVDKYIFVLCEFFSEGRAIRQCSSLMVENQPTCSLYASTQQCNCNTDECNVDQNCACNKGQGSIVMSFLPLIIQPMIVTFF